MPDDVPEMMSGLPETRRRTVNVLLDVLSAYSNDASEEVNKASMTLAMQALLDVGAITATTEGDDADIDVSELVNATAILTHWMASLLAHETGVAREDVIALARSVVNDEF